MRHAFVYWKSNELFILIAEGLKTVLILLRIKIKQLICEQELYLYTNGKLQVSLMYSNDVKVSPQSFSRYDSTKGQNLWDPQTLFKRKSLNICLLEITTLIMVCTISRGFALGFSKRTHTNRDIFFYL